MRIIYRGSRPVDDFLSLFFFEISSISPASVPFGISLSDGLALLHPIHFFGPEHPLPAEFPGHTKAYPSCCFTADGYSLCLFCFIDIVSVFFDFTHYKFEREEKQVWIETSNAISRRYLIRSYGSNQ